MIFNLHKPIYSSFYGIWDKWLRIAAKDNLKLVVNTPQGRTTYKNAREWKRGAKRMERYFKNPDVPMIFWGKNIYPEVKKRFERKKENLKTLSIMEGLKRIPRVKLEKLKMQVFS